MLDCVALWEGSAPCGLLVHLPDSGFQDGLGETYSFLSLSQESPSYRMTPLQHYKDDTPFLSSSFLSRWSSVSLSYRASPRTFPCLKVGGWRARVMYLQAVIMKPPGPMCQAPSCMYYPICLSYKSGSHQFKRRVLYFPYLFVHTSWILWSYWLFSTFSEPLIWGSREYLGVCYILFPFWPVFLMSFPFSEFIPQLALGDYVFSAHPTRKYKLIVFIFLCFIYWL